MIRNLGFIPSRQNMKCFLPILLLLLLSLQSCALRQNTPPVAERPALGVNQPTPSLPQYKPPKHEVTQQAATAKEALKPKFKELSPLDMERIDINFVEEGYRQVFQVLARAAGLNLVLDPQLEDLLATQKLTAEYQQIQVRAILDAISNILNVAWREDHGTLFIEPYMHETIHLDFLGSINKSNFSVGGDVLGGSGSGGGGGGSGGSNNIENPLNGRFEISGATSDKVTDIYTNIETTVGQLLKDKGEFILNRQTGTLMFQGRPRLVQQIKGYLNELREKYSRQVLIEAQIIEVNLDNSQKLGIDWRNFSVLASTEPLQNVAQTVLNVAGSSSGNDSFYNLNLSAEYYTLGSVFRALKQYGNVKILSNPRLNAMNGQSAVISVGQSVSYLRSLTKTTEGTGQDQTTELSTEIGAIFDGILLGVTPIIKDDGSVTLHVVPIKSEIAALDQQQLSADGFNRVTFPKVNLREMSTVVNIQPHNLVVLGGLIMEKNSEGEQGVPILGDLPGLGRLFKEKSTEKSRVEMVIIIQANVVKG